MKPVPCVETGQMLERQIEAWSITKRPRSPFSVYISREVVGRIPVGEVRFKKAKKFGEGFDVFGQGSTTMVPGGSQPVDYSGPFLFSISEATAKEYLPNFVASLGR